MSELTQELHSIVERAKLIEKGHDQKTLDLNAHQERADKRDQELNDRHVSLNDREAAITPIENVIQFRKDSQKLMEDAHAEREKLNADKLAWAKQVDSEKGQVENDRVIAKREADNNQKDRENIEALVLKRVKEVLCQFGQAELAQKI